MLPVQKPIFLGELMLSSKRKENVSAIINAQNVIQQEINGLMSLKNSLGQEFSHAIELILNIKGRVISSGIGKSGHIARKIAATLSSTGTPSLFVHSAEASHGDLGMITENDAVILLSNSGESIELNNIIEYCKRFAIPVIGISQNPTSTLCRASTVSLVLPNVPEASDISAPTTSSTMMLALGDALAVVLYERRGFTNADFKIFHPSGSIGARLLKVKELMHSGEEMPVVKSTMVAMDAILEMTTKRLGCVGIVEDHGTFAGIFTDGDLRRHINHDFKSITIAEIMTKKPLVIGPEMLASEALGIMNRKAITNIFIVENDKPIGIVHMHDILRAKVV